MYQDGSTVCRQSPIQVLGLIRESKKQPHDHKSNILRPSHHCANDRSSQTLETKYAPAVSCEQLLCDCHMLSVEKMFPSGQSATHRSHHCTAIRSVVYLIAKTKCHGNIIKYNIYHTDNVSYSHQF